MNMCRVNVSIVFMYFALFKIANSASLFESDINFNFYNKRNELSYKSNTIEDDLTIGSGCMSSEKVAIIIPGWSENCDAAWPKEMISNLNIYRGGCVLCMDYSKYSQNANYLDLFRDFYGIADVLINKLHQFVKEKFIPDNIFMFGFSFGAQLALESSRRLGTKLIGRIDVCEPAGPGFDINATYSKQNAMDSAKFVQCIHTSFDKGTNIRNCHQNWHMGKCGLSQLASGPFPMDSHGLCPHFYNSAFKNKFRAVSRPAKCPLTNRQPTHIPDGLFMGYLYYELSNVTITTGHDYYAETYRFPPYSFDIFS